VRSTTGTELETATETKDGLIATAGFAAEAIAEAGANCAAGICAGMELAAVADAAGRESIELAIVTGTGVGTRPGIGAEAAIGEEANVR